MDLILVIRAGFPFTLLYRVLLSRTPTFLHPYPYLPPPPPHLLGHWMLQSWGRTPSNLKCWLHFWSNTIDFFGFFAGLVNRIYNKPLKTVRPNVHPNTTKIFLSCPRNFSNQLTISQRSFESYWGIKIWQSIWQSRVHFLIVKAIMKY